MLLRVYFLLSCWFLFHLLANVYANVEILEPIDAYVQKSYFLLQNFVESGTEAVLVV
jgi:hypothetical protein